MIGTCKHCGGSIETRNPSGHCDHLNWPENLSDEAKIANGYRKVFVEQWVLASELPDPDDNQEPF